MPYHTLDSLMEDPHLAEVGLFQKVEHPTEGTIINLDLPNKLSRGARSDFRRPKLELDLGSAGGQPRDGIVLRRERLRGAIKLAVGPGVPLRRGGVGKRNSCGGDEKDRSHDSGNWGQSRICPINQIIQDASEA